MLAEEARAKYHKDRVDISSLLAGTAMGTSIRWAKKEVEDLNKQGFKKEARDLQDHIDVAEVAAKLADKKMTDMRLDE